MSRNTSLCMPLAAALALAACAEPVPAGQVLAIVNGEEITERDLVAEGDPDRPGIGQEIAPAASGKASSLAIVRIVRFGKLAWGTYVHRGPVILPQICMSLLLAHAQ